MEQTLSSSSSSSSSSTGDNNKTFSFSSIAGSLSDAVQGVIQTAATTIKEGLHIVNGQQDDAVLSPSSSEKEVEKETVAASVVEKVSEVADTVKLSLESSLEKAEEAVIPTVAAALEKVTDLTNNVVLKKEEGNTMSYSDYALEQFSRGGCTDKKLTMEMVAHIQRIADRTNDAVLHDMARKAHSAFAKGLHDAPGVHLTWITVEQANELVNLAIRIQDRALADFARYCQSVAATTQLGVEPYPGKILEELEKGRRDLANLGRTHTGPGYGAAFSTVPRPNTNTAATTTTGAGGMTKSISTTAVPAPKSIIIPSSSSSSSLASPPSSSSSMMKSYSTSNVVPRYGFGPSPTSPTAAFTPAPISPTSASTPSPISPTSASAPTRASFGTAPAGLTPKVYTGGSATTPAPAPQQQQQQQTNTMQKSASAYYVPPSKAAAIANGYIPLSQRAPGMMRSASSVNATASITPAHGSGNGKQVQVKEPTPAASSSTSTTQKKQMIKSFSTNTAAMPSVSTPIATDLKLTMDMVAHLQRIADRTGDAILHETARKAHSACAKGLNEAPGVHLAKITPEHANELVNLAIRTQDHGLADFARYCQSVAATTQLGIEPSPGKISQELAKGRSELASNGRSYTGPGYGAAFASLNKTRNNNESKTSPPSSPSAPSSLEATTSTPVPAPAPTHDAQGQIRADAVKAEPFVPLSSSQQLAQ